MLKDFDTDQWIQVAIVHGKIGECEDPDYPGMYVRIDDPTILSFISSVIGDALTVKPQTIGKSFFKAGKIQFG